MPHVFHRFSFKLTRRHRTRLAARCPSRDECPWVPEPDPRLELVSAITCSSRGFHLLIVCVLRRSFFFFFSRDVQYVRQSQPPPRTLSQLPEYNPRSMFLPLEIHCFLLPSCDSDPGECYHFLESRVSFLLISCVCRRSFFFSRDVQFVRQSQSHP